MHVRTLLWLALVGCGRLDFDPLGGSTPLAIATGNEFTCALANDRIACWGDGRLGQFGNGTLALSPTPVAGPSLPGTVALAAGLSHACALDAAGTMSCWGANTSNQVAPGGANPVTAPTAVTGLPAPVQAMGVGGDHSCALLVDRSVWCWGANDFGEVGVDTAGVAVTAPVKALDDVSVVAGGDAMTCAIRGDRSVWCWGDDTLSQLGDGATTSRATPQAIAGLVADDISCGDKHCCALVGDHYTCWGYDNDGEVGGGATTAVVSTPNALSAEGGYARIDAGNDHTCAIKSDGSAVCWGYDYEGELGDGAPMRNENAAVAVLATGPFVALAAGGHHSCAMRGDGTLVCWGYSSAGQVGTGLDAVRVPHQVTLPGPAAAISAGGDQACAVVSGALYCWGGDFRSELGDGNTQEFVAMPEQIAGITNATEISLGTYHSCVHLATDVAECWGANFDGQLGDGTETRRMSPTPTAMASVTHISSGAQFGCGTDAASIQCWGDDAHGEMNDLSGPERPMPTTIVATAGTQLAAGTNHACALIGNTIQCWGDNRSGQLGLGTTSMAETVSTVPGTWVAVGAGNGVTCARSLPSAISCWGRGFWGQIGDGTTLNRTSPTAIAVPGTGHFFQLGDKHTCAGSSAGVFCWGDNTHGELGDGTSTTRAAPTAVAAIPGAIAISAGVDFTCAIDNTSAAGVWCWGDNATGQIGTGTTSSTAIPVEVTLP